jgi:hypothetical protein
MTIDFKITLDIEKASKRAKMLVKYVGQQMKFIVNKTSLRLQKHIRNDLFGSYPEGTTEGSLSSRTGTLKKSVMVMPAVDNGNGTISGGITIGTRYAKVHFGKRGGITTITGKPWLKIPLPPVLNSSGVPMPFQKAFWLPSKKNPNDLVMYGKLSISKGKRAGETKGDIVPLFVLKHEVKVPVRISSEDLKEYIDPIIGRGLADLREGVQRSTLSDEV